MGSGGSGTGELPSLDAFDQEFEREPAAVLRARQHRRILRPLVGLLLAAAIISLPIWAWLSVDRRPISDGEATPAAVQISGRESSRAQVDRLLRQVAALEQEIRELTQAQQQSSESIAALKSAEQESRTSTATYWYSDPAALSFGTAGGPRPSAAVPPPRRSATARSESRERPRDGGAPMPLVPGNGE
jgi:uncharacterized protein HemX